MKRHTVILLLLGAMPCWLSGCLFVRHATRVVRDKEKQQPVQFESQRAQEFFVAGVHELQCHKQNLNVEVSAVPFLWWYSHSDELSDNAIYNDQISACDTNGDGVISMQEASTYRGNVTAQISAAEKSKSTDSKTSESVTESKSAASLEKPPALIDLSARSSK